MVTIVPPSPDDSGTPRRIQLRRTKGWRKPEGAVVVARPSRWGNPFPVEDYGQTGAVAAFRDALCHDTRRDFYYLDIPGEEARYLPVRSLRGRDLACWCPLDRPCHADVLLDLANR